MYIIITMSIVLKQVIIIYCKFVLLLNTIIMYSYMYMYMQLLKVNKDGHGVYCVITVQCLSILNISITTMCGMIKWIILLYNKAVLQWREKNSCAPESIQQVIQSISHVTLYTYIVVTVQTDDNLLQSMYMYMYVITTVTVSYPLAQS